MLTALKAHFEHWHHHHHFCLTPGKPGESIVLKGAPCEDGDSVTVTLVRCSGLFCNALIHDKYLALCNLDWITDLRLELARKGYELIVPEPQPSADPK